MVGPRYGKTDEKIGIKRIKKGSTPKKQYIQSFFYTIYFNTVNPL